MTGLSPLLPTPLAETRGPASRRGQRAHRGPSLREALALLPTPRADVREATGRVPREKWRPSLMERVQLLPTSVARDWKGPGYAGQLPGELLALLPTPSAADYGSNQSPSDGAAVGESLPRLVALLPTPVSADSRQSRNGTAQRRAGASGHPGMTLSDVAYGWSGASTSPRSAAGSRSRGLRLSPWFVEWMIGAPAGWSDPACRLSVTEFRSSWDR
ncbi:MAG: hypothetical protein ABSG43_26895 [Solirubrobacteraceae bacterium]